MKSAPDADPSSLSRRMAKISVARQAQGPPMIANRNRIGSGERVTRARHLRQRNAPRFIDAESVRSENYQARGCPQRGFRAEEDENTTESEMRKERVLAISASPDRSGILGRHSPAETLDQNLKNIFIGDRGHSEIPYHSCSGSRTSPGSDAPSGQNGRLRKVQPPGPRAGLHRTGRIVELRRCPHGIITTLALPKASTRECRQPRIDAKDSPASEEFE